MTRGRAKIGPSARKRANSGRDGEQRDRPLKIGEAARLVGVESYVLRFWETQFPFLRPRQSRSRHRFYSPTDLETLKIIKRLLHTEGYTIIGARKYVREKGLEHLRGLMPSTEMSKAASAQERTAKSLRLGLNSHRTLCEIREDLRLLHKMLQGQS